MDEIALFHLFKHILDYYAILCEVKKKNGLNCCSLFSMPILPPFTTSWHNCHIVAIDNLQLFLFFGQLQTNKSQWQQVAIGTSGTSYTILVITSVGLFSLGDLVLSHIEN